jgi:hypothetical protein
LPKGENRYLEMSPVSSVSNERCILDVVRKIKAGNELFSSSLASQGFKATHRCFNTSVNPFANSRNPVSVLTLNSQNGASLPCPSQLFPALSNARTTADVCDGESGRASTLLRRMRVFESMRLSVRGSMCTASWPSLSEKMSVRERTQSLMSAVSALRRRLWEGPHARAALEQSSPLESSLYPHSFDLILRPT